MNGYLKEKMVIFSWTSHIPTDGDVVMAMFGRGSLFIDGPRPGRIYFWKKMTPSRAHLPSIGLSSFLIAFSCFDMVVGGTAFKAKREADESSFYFFSFSFSPCGCPFPLNDRVPSASFNIRANNDLSSLNFRWGTLFDGTSGPECMA